MTDRWSSKQEGGSPPRTRVEMVGNLVLRKVVLKACGVDAFTLSNLVALRHVLAEEFLADNGGEDRPTPEYVAECDRQMIELASNHSEEIKARETAAAREKMFGRYLWFVPGPGGSAENAQKYSEKYSETIPAAEDAA